MFHQGTCSKDKALNETHMNHMEWEQEFAKNQSNSSSLGIIETWNLQDYNKAFNESHELAITQELVVSKVRG